MRIRNWGICFFCLVLFLLRTPASGITTPILPSADHVWFAAKHGLSRYDKAQDEWSVFLAGNDVRDIGIDEGIIWDAPASDVYNSDVRFSDWRSYTMDDGLPSDNVKCVAFSEDCCEGDSVEGFG